MRGENKIYTNWIDVHLHFMLVVEVIKLNRILYLLMTHIVTPNWFMDWQKYPKSKMSIRIWQPETLDRIKCHTFPGLGSRTLDILLLLHDFQFCFCAKGFNWVTCPLKQFNCDTCPGPVCARQSDSRTSKSTWRLAEGCFGPALLRRAGWLPSLAARLPCAGHCAGPARHA
jgi:hypothetical protein